MTSAANTVDQYLNELPADRRDAVNQLRQAVVKNLPKGFEETMQYGMISYVVPHSVYPAGYHCNPKDALPFASVASQKNSINFYHMGIYAMPDLLQWFQQAYAAKYPARLDMGKSCMRFKKPEHIPYDLIGQLMKKLSAKDWIGHYEANIKR